MYIIILLLSIWQSILFWHKEPGISVFLFVLPLVIVLIKYLEKNNKVKNKQANLIAIPIIMLSATYFIFNNEFLNSVNTLAIPGLIVLMVIELTCDKFTLEKAISNVLSFTFKPIGCFGIVGKKLIGKIKKDENIENKKSKNIKRFLKAIAISLPLLLLVLILLVTADSDFAKLFIKIIDYTFRAIDKFKISNLTGRIIGIVFVFFYLAGFIENIILTKEIERNTRKIKEKDSLTIKIIITVLNLMYVVFCIIQVNSIIKLYTMDKANYSYSYYARQGFFQLMVVSAINLVMILKSKNKCYKKENYIKIMDLCMVILTGTILVFSFVRMYFYQQSFGFTLKRVLVFWAQITEAILLIPTLMYVVDKKLNLEKTYFVIIVTMYVILNFININRLIAKVNVDMYLERRWFDSGDIYYLEKLGSDAIPETTRILELEKTKDDATQITKKHYIQHLQETYNNMKNEKTFWQEFNISKTIAKKILKEKL